MSVDLINLSKSEIRRIKRDRQKVLEKKYKEDKKKMRKLIDNINKINKAIEKLTPKPKPKPNKIKTFEEYFQECIKNKTISLDTPSYLRKALERAIKEYDQGII